MRNFSCNGKLKFSVVRVGIYIIEVLKGLLFFFILRFLMKNLSVVFKFLNLSDYKVKEI